MRKYNNPRLLNTVVAGPGMKHPTKPHVIVGDNGEFIQGDLMDANAVGELVDQKIDDSEEHIIPKIDELSEQLEQEITNREAADEDLSETIDSRIQDVVGAAPEALDTLKELADALNDDANFAATVTNELTELDERVDNNTSGISSLNTRVASLHQDISGKEDVTTIVAPVNTTDATLPITTLTTEIGKYYRIDVPIETLGVTLPAMGVVTSVKTITIYLTGGTTPAVTITAADSKSVVLQDGYEIKSGKTYEVSCLYNGAAWVIGALTINTGE